MNLRFYAFIAMLICSFTHAAIAKESSTYDIATRSEILSAPASPDCASGCDNYVTTNRTNKAYTLYLTDGETYCVTSNFKKLNLIIYGNGGTLRICGNVTINSISHWSDANVNIEVTSESTLNLNLNTWNKNTTVHNWGTLSGSISTNGDFINYAEANLSTLEVRQNSTLTNTSNISVSNSLTISGEVVNSGTISVNRDITLASNSTLTNTGNLTTNRDVYSSGTIDNAGAISAGDDFYSRNTLTNSGTITVNDYAELNNTVTNSGELIVKDDLGIYNSTFTNTESGTVSVTDDVTVSSSPVTNSGDISTGDRLTINYNSFTNTETGSISSGGNLTTNSNNLTNSGTIDTGNSATLNNGSLTNIGSLTVSNDLTANTTTINSGTIAVEDNYVIKKTLTNSGSIETTGTITNSDWNTITNSGSITTDENFDQYGKLYNSGDVVVEDTYTDKNWRLTQMEDGSTLTTGNLTLNSTITGNGEYSTVTVLNTTTINSNATVDGNIALIDENGLETNNGNIAASVELRDFIPGADVDTNQIVPFNGTDNYVVVADNNDLDIQSSGTIEIMLKLDSYLDYAGIIHKGESSDFSDEAYTLQMGGNNLGTSNKNVMFAIVDGSNSATIITSVDQLELNKWYHIVACWDGSYAYLYINGVLQAQIANSITPRNSSGDLIIGTQIPAERRTTNKYPFSGSMDNIRLWNKCFTGDDVWDTFGSTITETQDNLVLNLTFEEITTSRQGSYFTSSTTNALKAYLNNYGNIQDIEDVAEVEDIIDEVSTEDGVIAAGSYEYLIIENGESITASEDFTCTNLIIKENGVIYIPEGVTITIQEDLFIKSKATGFGQILVEGTLDIGGEVHVEHSFIGGGVWQFLTVPTTISDFSIFGDTFNEDYAVFYYDENVRANNGHSDNVWAIPSALKPGTGYIFAFATDKSVIFDISAQEYFDTENEAIDLNFTTSDKVSDAGWNLVGNPFQSEVSWDKVIEAVENDIFINGGAGAAIYFFDNATGNYQSYVSGASTNGLDGTINPMDAFFIKSFASGAKLSIKRKFFPSTLVTRNATLDQPKVLKAALSNSSSIDETVIRFNEEASDYTDEQFDAYKEFGGSNLCQIYTKSVDNTALSINTLESDQQQVELELFVKCPSAGSYTINFDNIESFDTDAVYLIDKKDGLMINLADEASYSFNTDASGTLDRFLIVTKSNQLTTSIEESTATVPFYYYNGQIRLLDNSLKGDVSLYNSIGQNIFTSRTQGNAISLPNDLAPGVYIATINGTSLKIFIQ